MELTLPFCNAREGETLGPTELTEALGVYSERNPCKLNVIKM